MGAAFFISRLFGRLMIGADYMRLPDAKQSRPKPGDEFYQFHVSGVA
jgi:hypothetical protein